ncbi:hypothetical protein X797_002550 [Metarhizium robertsii]|uniref:Uncharacterized protein n=2 Tax=Metarhizium robertsii TaxID=568076 RepID=E9EYT2_METRA|nr:uncharacterized protein MAA_05181 [Metarhizium robertsii ARSEF 23]EFY99123.1 hypothetical protein MAA_05181 [Metarhizium robertsii ARSEF 23]EXV04866.1 hypothetical protein X797_002550 [Metarhizium robertsii]
MSVTSSPQQSIQALLRRRSLTVVPQDQQNILDKDGAWAVEGNQRQGQPHVPNHVLETITEAFLRRKERKSKLVNINELPETFQLSSDGGNDESAKKHGTVNADDLPNAIQCHSVDRIVESVEDQVNKEQQDAGDDEQSDGQSSTSSEAHSRLTWSTSPDRGARERPLTTPSQSQAVQETPIPNPRPGLLNTLPQPEPHRLAVRTAKEDEEEEDEMDMRLPQAHEQPDVRINLESTRPQIKSTPAMNIASQVVETETPPCAQPNQDVIPYTVDSNRVSARIDPGTPQKRRKRFKMYDINTTPAKPVNASTSFTRLPNTLRIKEVESSLSTSSSSIIPATCLTASTQNSTTAAPPLASPIPLPNPNDHEPRSLAPTTTCIPTESQAHSVNPRISPVTASNPYILFTTTYPSYPSQNGTLKNFVNACICLEFLASGRALREFLYDDFIRAYSAEYRKYVTGARAGQEPLPAVEWFNMLQGEPEYSKMVITKQNLQHVLDMFPDEVARTRRYLSHKTREPGNEKAVEGRGKPLSRDHVVNADVPTPDISPPRPAKRQRPSPPSPELGSDAHEPRDAAPPSPVRSKAPRASQYFERLASATKSDARKQRSAEERKALLREHIRRRKASGALSARSRHGST